jgi:flavin reductase (DIM6/NTAB) family NADH-FMN oxidoreductase RutF
VNTISITPSVLYFGTPVALITTLNPDGSSNISPMSSAWALADRVVLGLSANGQGLANIERELECVINLPSSHLWQHVERLAPTTGREPVPEYKRAMGYRFEADKFGIAEFTVVPSKRVKPARILECPLQLEARVLQIYPVTPDGTGRADECRIIETQVVHVHAHENIVEPGTNHIDLEHWSPLWYVFRHYFGKGQDLGKNFRAETEPVLMRLTRS